MVWRSTYEPIETGDATLHESILATAAAMGDRVALVDGPSGAAVTYAALAARIERAAAGLAARGLGPGDVLALWAPNSPEWAIAALGAMAAGATVSGVSPVATERELAAQLMDCEASILVTVPARLPAAREVARDGRRARGRGARRRRGATARRRRSRSTRARRGAAAVLERHHRPAQGRHAHPREPRGRRRAGARRR